MKIQIHTQSTPAPMSIDWRWTGFTPAKLLLEDDMAQTLRYLAAIPRQGVRQVRIHLLLDLVTAHGLGTDTPVYNWSRLDTALQRLIDNDLIPFFELMGNPSKWFNDYKDLNQARAWKTLIRDLALHLEDTFGKETVREWYFETWNEPDVPWWPYDEEAFLIYYDACSEGLMEADPELRFGGPGTCMTLSPVMRKLLAHVDQGKSHLTGKPGVRMDFLSVHEKGAWGTVPDVPVCPEHMVSTTRELRAYLREHHPRLLELPLMNNECDPHIGWKDPHTWRAHAFYPAIMAKGLLMHYETLVDEDQAPFILFGNDNGFIGSWEHRTQLTRFARKGFETTQFELVKKPALSLMTGLSLLGDDRLRTEVLEGDRTQALCTSLGKQGFAAVICRADNRDRFSAEDPAEITFEGLADRAYTLIEFRIDEHHGNPFRIWEDLHFELEARKQQVVAKDIAAMRAVQELTRFGETQTVSPSPEGKITLTRSLPLPGVHFILLLDRTAFQAPGPVKRLRAEPYDGLHNHAKILLSWIPPESRAVTDHLIEWRREPSAAWETLPHPPLLDGSWVHTPDIFNPNAAYRVTPVDVWGQSGPPVEVQL